MTSNQIKNISLKTTVGGGYYDFWNFKGRYRVCKGSRASKKSKTTALNIIVRMMQYPEANNRFDWKTLFFYHRTYELHRIANAREALVGQKRNQK